MPPPSGSPVGLYTRVSQDRAREAASVEQQDRELRAQARREGLQITHSWCDNDQSASRYARREREQWPEVLDAIRAGAIRGLMVWEFSRATRDLEVFTALRRACSEAGVLLSYGGRWYDLADGSDVFRVGIDALIAERASSETSERVQRSARALAAAGRPHGKLLYGYTREYHPETRQFIRQVIVPEQAAVIREAAERFVAGQSLYRICRDFDARGIPLPRAAETRRPAKQSGWYTSTLKALLTNPGYIGKRVHRGEVVGAAVWPPILDEPVFAAVRARFAAEADVRARSRPAEYRIRHLLSGLAECGVCEDGGLIRTQRMSVNRAKDKYFAYVCRACLRVSRKQVWVDEYVTAVVVEMLRSPQLAQLLAERSADTSAAQAASAELAQLQDRLDAAEAEMVAGRMTAAMLARLESRLTSLINDARARMDAASAPSQILPALGADADVRWAGLVLEQRRAVIRNLVRVRILSAQGRGGNRSFNPESVQITPRYEVSESTH